MSELTKDQITERIAKNVAALVNETQETFVLNLGVGIPTKVADYIENENVYIQSENGMLGVGPIAHGDQIHPDLINAGRQPVHETAGCVYMDSAMSFGMIRGGHIDATVLGAFEVDTKANIANWIIPGGKQLGVGGAMDLVSGAKRVIIAMTHTNKGKPKLVPYCTLPITGFGRASVVITEKAAFFFENEGWILKKIAPDTTLAEIKLLTKFKYQIAETLEPMEA